MLTQLRRGAIFCIICLVLFGLVYPLRRRRALPALLQAPGRRLHHRQRLDPDRAELVPDQVPGPPARQLRVPGPPRCPRPVLRRRNPRATTRPGTPATTRWWPTGSPASPGPPTSGPVRKSCSTTPRHSSPTGTRGACNPTSDLVTTSGSGIDPDITPQDAQAEIPMVSRATGLSAAVLAAPDQPADPGHAARFPGVALRQRAAAQRGAGQARDVSAPRPPSGRLVPRRRSRVAGKIESVVSLRATLGPHRRRPGRRDRGAGPALHGSRPPCPGSCRMPGRGRGHAGRRARSARDAQPDLLVRLAGGERSATSW